MKICVFLNVPFSLKSVSELILLYSHLHALNSNWAQNQTLYTVCLYQKNMSEKKVPLN